MLRFCRNAGWFAPLLLMGWLGTAEAGTMSLEWDAATNAQGYRLYYGTTPGQYANVKDVGNTLSSTLTGLADCTTWYVAVKAYNAAGESPAFSNEVTGLPRPAIASAGPATMQGRQVTLNVTGANYQTGAEVEIDNPHVSLQNARVLSCNQMQVVATVEPMAEGVRAAEVGVFTVTVTNPDRVYGAQSNAFQVLINPERYDVNKADSATSGRLDGKDTVFLARAFGAREGDAAWDPDGDFNGDGWIDGQDLAHLAGNLGWCWSGTTWTAAACANR